MKIIKTSLLTFAVIGLAVSASAQKTVKTEKMPVKQIKEQTVAAPIQEKRKYVFPEAELASYFKSGKIHEKFPLFDKLKSEEDNKKIAKGWAIEHKELLTDEAIKKFGL